MNRCTLPRPRIVGKPNPHHAAEVAGAFEKVGVIGAPFLIPSKNLFPDCFARHRELQDKKLVSPNLQVMVEQHERLLSRAVRETEEGRAVALLVLIRSLGVLAGLEGQEVAPLHGLGPPIRSLDPVSRGAMEFLYLMQRASKTLSPHRKDLAMEEKDFAQGSQRFVREHPSGEFAQLKKRPRDLLQLRWRIYREWSDRKLPAGSEAVGYEVARQVEFGIKLAKSAEISPSLFESKLSVIPMLEHIFGGAWFLGRLESMQGNPKHAKLISESSRLSHGLFYASMNCNDPFYYATFLEWMPQALELLGQSRLEPLESEAMLHGSLVVRRSIDHLREALERFPRMVQIYEQLKAWLEARCGELPNGFEFLKATSPDERVRLLEKLKINRGAMVRTPLRNGQLEDGMPKAMRLLMNPLPRKSRRKSPREEV